MRKIFVMAAFVCIAAMNVNAQTEGTESKNEKMIRLTKAADENPTDWKAQFDAGLFLVDKENGVYDPSKAEKYYERLFHLAMDLNKEVPDSVIPATGLMLTGMASGKQDLDRALFYIDAMRHAEKMGVRLGEDGSYSYVFDMYGASFSMAEGDMERSLYYMTELRNHLTKENKPGIEYTDVMTAMLYDMLMSKYKDMYGDKLMELTIDDKKYITLSMEDWNIEKPLMGWWKEMDGDKNWLYYCCDDGKVYDELHGEMDMSFYCDKDGIKLEDTANMRLISVTPERRQQLVEAYRKYMKKAKKNK